MLASYLPALNLLTPDTYLQSLGAKCRNGDRWGLHQFGVSIKFACPCPEAHRKLDGVTIAHLSYESGAGINHPAPGFSLLFAGCLMPCHAQLFHGRAKGEVNYAK